MTLESKMASTPHSVHRADIFNNDPTFTSGCTDSDCQSWPVGSWFFSITLEVTAFSGMEQSMSDTGHVSSQSL